METLGSSLILSQINVNVSLLRNLLGFVRSESILRTVLERSVTVPFRNIFRVAFLLSCHLFS